MLYASIYLIRKLLKKNVIYKFLNVELFIIIYIDKNTNNIVNTTIIVIVILILLYIKYIEYKKVKKKKN